MRVKILTSLEGPNVSHIYGEVVDSEHPQVLISADAMKRMVSLGQAEEVKALASKVEKAAPMTALQRASLPPKVEAR